MASHTLPRPFLRLPFRTHPIRPFSSTTPHLLPSPQNTPPPPTTPTPQPQQKPTPVSNLSGLITSIGRDAQAQTTATTARRSALAETEAAYRATDLERHLHRRFRPGDIYAPHDLSPTEQAKWRPRAAVGGSLQGRGTPANTHAQNRRDVFDVLGVHPLDEYKNFSIMTEFVSSMGRIRHRRETGLRGVNQRRVAKAVRRAVGMGLLPSVHKHPEMLEKEAEEMARTRPMRMVTGPMGRERGFRRLGGS
ncbi:MAG: hypothetical protein LQ339_005646 [Xanthoria mediterranea]|nr:MAG: hypothetical protein LQ339_005646 [Xanthoria mediterranea]